MPDIEEVVGMDIKGSCRCNNIELHWHTVDLSLVPRACQCDYCRAQAVAWVSKSGSRVEVLIRKTSLYKTVQQGSMSALFHECSHCKQVVCATAEINGDRYGVLNANVMRNKLGFEAAVEMNLSEQSPEEKQSRWQANWCCPVVITVAKE